MQLLPEIEAFLLCPTPDTWIAQALQNQDVMLIDHANCEKKAASTALTLLFRYIEKADLQHNLSRLAREELRHFEQVAALMKKRGIAYRPVSAALYAQRLHKHMRTSEPHMLVGRLMNELPSLPRSSAMRFSPRTRNSAFTAVRPPNLSATDCRQLS